MKVGTIKGFIILWDIIKSKSIIYQSLFNSPISKLVWSPLGDYFGFLFYLLKIAFIFDRCNVRK